MRIYKQIIGLLTVFILSHTLYGIEVGEVAPGFTFTRLNGEELSLSDYEGKVVFLFLFGNQCGFCVSSGIKTETDAHQIYKDNSRVQFIGLDLWNNSSSTATVGAFREQTGITYPLCLNAGSIASAYEITIDRIIVIGTDGYVYFKGTHDAYTDLEDAIAAIEYVLDLTEVEEMSLTSDKTFDLSQNYPNPFNSETQIHFTLSESGLAVMTLFDMLGHEVMTIANDHFTTGTHSIRLNMESLPAGVYYYRLVSNGKTLTRKLMYLK